MCRINGIISDDINEPMIIKMRDCLTYGGPDDAGIYINKDDKIGLGHRRLSILDLSENGHQPMFWNNYIIVFNGEIYNFKEISNELKLLGYQFTSGSDTEVILKSFEKWGYEAVKKFRGMFAFALWNKNTKTLLLCRDRVGVKPLYWYQKDNLFMFASELKAFTIHPEFDNTINHEAVALFLQTGYIKAPYSIYKYAHKLEPGSFLELSQNKQINIWKYWEIRKIYSNIITRTSSDYELIKECEEILTESFKLRMVSDVPVGMFLSGGIDSTLVTTLLQNTTDTPLNTFTIGFEDPNLNEAHHAKKIANYLGTNHNELYCTKKEFEEIIPQLPELYDEPFGDSSSIPTYLVSKLARQKVKVSLSADGGDEVFTGYNRYLYSNTLYNRICKIPFGLRKIISRVVDHSETEKINNLVRYLPISFSYKKHIDARLPKLSQIMVAKSKMDYLYASTLFITPQKLSKLHEYNSDNVFVFNKDLEIKENLLYSAYGIADIESYLEGDILTKVDRATMQVSLEGREPFLDHKIIEFALSLPDNMKIRNGETKWILRQILNKYIPNEMLERPKMGFGIPLDFWLSSILKNDLLAIKSDYQFANCFKLNITELNQLINNYLAKKTFSTYLIWYLYCLHQWYLKWMK